MTHWRARELECLSAVIATRRKLIERELELMRLLSILRARNASAAVMPTGNLLIPSPDCSLDQRQCGQSSSSVSRRDFTPVDPSASRAWRVLSLGSVRASASKNVFVAEDRRLLSKAAQCGCYVCLVCEVVVEPRNAGEHNQSCPRCGCYRLQWLPPIFPE